MTAISEEDQTKFDDLKAAYKFQVPSPISKGEVYHYCSAETFHAVVSKKTIRMSDISKMNDFMELDWGLDIVKNEIKSQTKIIGKELSGKLLERLDFAKTKSRFLISCFSMNNDILSQWRSYADNGSGFPIGFDSEKLSDSIGILGLVIYSKSKQRDIIKGILLTGSSLWHQCPESTRKRFETKIALNLIYASCYMKNPAFSEEKEVRAIKGVLYSESGNDFRIEVPGNDKINIEFCIRNGQIVPFADRNYSKIENTISSVKLEPKNVNSEVDVKAMLRFNSHKTSNVDRSSASYR